MWLSAADGGTSAGVIVLIVVGVVLLALYLATLASILRSTLDSRTKLLWILGCLVFQFFGPLLWFLVGRKTAARRTY